MSRTLNIINNRYFDWMCGLVCDEKHADYRELLSYLHNRDFTYTLEFDGNRAEDGLDLRYRFAYEHHYDVSLSLECLDRGSCSVLEMMVALALRCEEDVMDDPDMGNRTGQWFWIMITNLGLGAMRDSRFSERRAEVIIDRLLNRDYAPDGEGGLFVVRNCKHDMRTVEIWRQMCWYINYI